MKETCALCGTETKCNFGMHGIDLRVFFCTVNHMIEYAKQNKYEPFSGSINVYPRLYTGSR